jgi:hypothetical protein
VDIRVEKDQQFLVKVLRGQTLCHVVLPEKAQDISAGKSLRATPSPGFVMPDLTRHP